MSRRETLLKIGGYFNNPDLLKEAVGKDVLTDMAIIFYAMETNKVHMLSGLLDIDELAYDIAHTEKH